jgi:hypothetical protein
MSDKNGQSACDHSHYVTLQNSMTGVKIPNRDSNFAAESGQVLHVQVASSTYCMLIMVYNRFA